MIFSTSNTMREVVAKAIVMDFTSHSLSDEDCRAGAIYAGLSTRVRHYERLVVENTNT